MNKFESLVERIIREAIEKGELRNLEGEGKPMDLSEDPFTPEDRKMVNRILKNSGFVPREVEMLRELADLREMIRGETDQERREFLQKKLYTKETSVQSILETIKRSRR